MTRARFTRSLTLQPRSPQILIKAITPANRMATSNNAIASVVAGRTSAERYRSRRSSTGVERRLTLVVGRTARSRRSLLPPSPSSAAAECRSSTSAYIPWESRMRPTAPTPRWPNARGGTGDMAVATDRHDPHLVVRLQVIEPDVELAVAESVDPQHLGMDAVGLVAGQRHHAGHQHARVDRRAELGRDPRRCTDGRPPARTRRARRTWHPAPRAGTAGWSARRPARRHR